MFCYLYSLTVDFRQYFSLRSLEVLLFITFIFCSYTLIFIIILLLLLFVRATDLTESIETIKFKFN